MIKRGGLIGFLFLLVWCQARAQGMAWSGSTEHHTDSVVTYASNKYEPHSFFRRLFMGSNYRNEWEQYVTVPVFHFGKSGFRIVELGGGMQTKSLKLVDSAGKSWSLRTVDKEVSRNLDPSLQNPVGRKIAQDLISASFPYAVPLAGELAHAAGINAARPKIYFVADDTALGDMRSIFGNTLCSLEERDPGFSESFSTQEAYDNIMASSRYRIEQKILLRARLLDILIGDWDRHEGNWRWGLKDSAGFLFYHAIPRDRDWSFYQSKGLFPKLAQKSNNTQYFIDFDGRLKKVKQLSFKSWLFDRTFMNELTADDWKLAITEIKALLTPDALKNAIASLPKEIQTISGKTMLDKLTQRLSRFEKQVMKYYRFLTEEIIVNGSAEKETFVLTLENNKPLLKVMANHSSQIIFQRVLDDDDIRTVTLNGLGGDDTFLIEPSFHSTITINLNGGNGTDQYQLQGKAKVHVNDAIADQDIVTNNANAKIYLK